MRESKVQQKMRQSAKEFFATRPVPDVGADAMEGEVPVTGPPEKPAVPSYREFPILRKKSTAFRTLIEQHNLLRANMELLASQQAKIRGDIQMYVELAGQKSVMVDAILITRTEGRKPSEKIDRKRITRQLMKRGFTADDAAVIVALSTVKGKPGRPSLVITDTSKPRGRKREEGE
jgi:hypothetical protein